MDMFTPALAGKAMQYRRQSGPGALARTGTSLARATGSSKGQRGPVSGDREDPDGVGSDQGVRKRSYGQGDTDHQQQELLLVVAARLAADQILRAGVR